jgi:transcriptional regulator of acetoin/glycerol metabolism
MSTRRRKAIGRLKALHATTHLYAKTGPDESSPATRNEAVTPRRKTIGPRLGYRGKGPVERCGGFPKLRDVRKVGIALLEKQYLQALVSRTHGNVKEALRISGLSRSRLYGLLKAHDISIVD